jgi:hypothetical protein
MGRSVWFGTWTVTICIEDFEKPLAASMKTVQRHQTSDSSTPSFICPSSNIPSTVHRVSYLIVVLAYFDIKLLAQGSTRISDARKPGIGGSAILA